jgi:hypothetical protein
MIIDNFSEFLIRGTLDDFLIPPILSFLFLPFIYGLSLYFNYEDVFTGINQAINKPGLIKYAKKQAIIHFHVNIKNLKRWRSSIFLRKANTKKEILESIIQIKQLDKIEKRPPFIPYRLGWSPYEAMVFLVKKNVSTGYYQQAYDNVWFASSKYIDIEKGLLSNNISYYIEGTSSMAKSLKLILNIYNIATSRTSHSAFIQYATVLYQEALQKNMPNDVVNAIKIGLAKQITEGSRKMLISKKKWPNNKLKGYIVEFTIEVIAG